MTIFEKIESYINNNRIKNIGKFCFLIGLTIELMVLVLEKSAYVNPIESWMFRISFCFFLIKCICTKYSKRDVALLTILGIIAILSYAINSKDEIVRFVVFVVAMKDIDLSKILKYVFWFTSIGMSVLMLASITGLLGTIIDQGEGYGYKAGITRLCLGMGSANTLSIMLWALMTLGIYVYYKRMKWWSYLILMFFSVLVYVATFTRTSLALMIITITSTFVLTNVKKLQFSRCLYFLCEILLLAFVGFSVWAAKVSDQYEHLTPFQYRINELLTGRIECISRWKNGGGKLANWLLFSNPDFEEFFDMGYVRMFFWYGIIPSSVIIITMMYMIYKCYYRRDYMGLVLIMSFALFTVIEAHIVSVYIGRNYLLFLAGACLFTKDDSTYREPQQNSDDNILQPTNL